MGVYLSDGSVSQRGHFSLGVADEEFRDEVAQAMKMVGAKFGLGPFQPGPVTDHRTGKVYTPKRLYRLREHAPLRVGGWLEDVFPSGRDHLPSIPEDLVRDLVAGVMDGDGSIWLRNKVYYELCVCGYSNYLDDLEFLFEDHGVLMYYRPGAINHNINIRSFVEAGFYFRMPRKQALVEGYKKEVL